MQNQEVQQMTFEELPYISDLNNSGSLIKSYIQNQGWINSFNCVTELRKINKFHPEFVPDIIESFSETILELLSTGKPLLVKNIFRLLKELFDAGKEVSFLSEQLILVAAENCYENNESVAEQALKLVEKLLKKIGSGIMQLQENTLIGLMKCFSNLIDGKRQNMSKQTLDICMFVCQAISSENYVKLIQYCLTPNEQQSMIKSMETYRTGKEKLLSTKEAIKNRQARKCNNSFWNEIQNYQIPQDKKQMNQVIVANQNKDQNQSQLKILLQKNNITEKRIKQIQISINNILQKKSNQYQKLYEIKNIKQMKELMKQQSYKQPTFHLLDIIIEYQVSGWVDYLQKVDSSMRLSYSAYMGGTNRLREILKSIIQIIQNQQ